MQLMDFPHFMEWSFLGLCSAGLVVLWQMKESVNILNAKIEVLIVQHTQAREDLDDHEVRLRDLERHTQ